MGRNRLTQNDEKIRELYQTLNLHETAEAVGCSWKTVRRSLIAQGIPLKQSVTTKGSCKLEPHFEEIKKLYEGGCTLTFLTQRFDCDFATLRKFMKANGLELKKEWTRNPRGKNLSSLPPETVQAMVTRYIEQEQTLKELSMEFKISTVSVRKLLLGAGVVMRDACTRKKTADEKLTTVLRRGFGVDAAWHSRTLKKQEYKCAICGCEATDLDRNKGKTRFNVDHDHTTGAVRGLLCSKCNMAIGMLKDSPSLLRKAADYLDSYSPLNPLPLATPA